MCVCRRVTPVHVTSERQPSLARASGPRHPATVRVSRTANTVTNAPVVLRPVIIRTRGGSCACDWTAWQELLGSETCRRTRRGFCAPCYVCHSTVTKRKLPEKLSDDTCWCMFGVLPACVLLVAVAFLVFGGLKAANARPYDAVHLQPVPVALCCPRAAPGGGCQVRPPSPALARPRLPSPALARPRPPLPCHALHAGCVCARVTSRGSHLLSCWYCSCVCARPLADVHDRTPTRWFQVTPVDLSSTVQTQWSLCH